MFKILSNSITDEHVSLLSPDTARPLGTQPLVTATGEPDMLYDIPDITRKKLVRIELADNQTAVVAIVDQENGITDPKHIARILSACKIKGMGDPHGSLRFFEILEKAGGAIITGHREQWLSIVEQHHRNILTAKNIDNVLDCFGTLKITQNNHTKQLIINFGPEETPMQIEISIIESDNSYFFTGDYTDRGFFSYLILTASLMLAHQKNTLFLAGNHDAELAKGNRWLAVEGLTEETLRSWDVDNTFIMASNLIADAFAKALVKICGLISINEEMYYLLSHAGFNNKIIDCFTDFINLITKFQEVTPQRFTDTIQTHFQLNWAKIRQMQELDQRIKRLSSIITKSMLKTFKSSHRKPANQQAINQKIEELATLNSQLSQLKMETADFLSSIYFLVGPARSGDAEVGGPLWQDASEHFQSSAESEPKEPKMRAVRQIMGHTDTATLLGTQNAGPIASEDNSAIFIDGGMYYGGTSFVVIHPIDGRAFGLVKNQESGQWVCSLIAEPFQGY
jgi:hypothetical protein